MILNIDLQYDLKYINIPYDEYSDYINKLNPIIELLYSQILLAINKL